jgi:hypothetical protein
VELWFYAMLGGVCLTGRRIKWAIWLLPLMVA